MKQTFCIFIILLITISCSQKTVPVGLRKTINQMEKNLNDTVKYDFRIAPESVAGTKHHFGLGLGLKNGKGLWSGSLLRTYFRMNGINHPDDMSAIILTTLHRKLNDKPINFKEQKKYYKEYWKVAKIGRDTLERYWESKYNLINNDSIDQVYFSNFTKGRLVLGSVGAWKQLENGASGIDVKMIAEIIERNQRKLKLKIIELGKSEEGFELWEKVGDTIESDPYGVYLIPTAEN
jgi:hypothetical protein